MKKKRATEKYILTVKGFLLPYEGVYDALMLYMYQHGDNGIVLDKGELHFVSIQKQEGK